jgi:hypothetical protein
MSLDGVYPSVRPDLPAPCQQSVVLQGIILPCHVRSDHKLMCNYCGRALCDVHAQLHTILYKQNPIEVVVCPVCYLDRDLAD